MKNDCAIVQVKVGSCGRKPRPGKDGKSAYDIWLEAGNTGTEQDFLDSLKADGALDPNNVMTKPFEDGSTVILFDPQGKPYKVSLSSDFKPEVEDQKCKPITATLLGYVDDPLAAGGETDTVGNVEGLNPIEGSAGAIKAVSLLPYSSLLDLQITLENAKEVRVFTSTDDPNDSSHSPETVFAYKSHNDYRTFSLNAGNYTETSDVSFDAESGQLTFSTEDKYAVIFAKSGGVDCQWQTYVVSASSNLVEVKENVVKPIVSGLDDSLLEYSFANTPTDPLATFKPASDFVEKVALIGNTTALTGKYDANGVGNEWGKSEMLVDRPQSVMITLIPNTAYSFTIDMSEVNATLPEQSGDLTITHDGNNVYSVTVAATSDSINFDSQLVTIQVI